MSNGEIEVARKGQRVHVARIVSIDNLLPGLCLPFDALDRQICKSLANLPI